MSCDYGLHCKHHDVTELFADHFGHTQGAQTLSGALVFREKLAASVEARKLVESLGGYWPGRDSSVFDWVAEFLHTHHACSVVVMDEYGVEWGQCGRYSKGPCGHDHHCTLADGHTEPCNWGRR